MGYADSWTRDLAANLTANVGILYDRPRLRQRYEHSSSFRFARWRLRVQMTLATDFKSFEIGITKSYETIRTSIYGPCSRQGIASSGYVSTRRATILAPSFIPRGRPGSCSCRVFWDRNLECQKAI